jgi:hypothetical protein
LASAIAQETRQMHSARPLQLRSSTICVTELAMPEKQLHHNRSLSLASGSMLEERMHHNRSLSLASGSMLQEQMHNNKGRVVAPVMSNCIGLICLMCFRLQATEQQSSE